MQPDGKLLAVGTNTIARFNADLTPDSTFGQGGRVLTTDLNASAPVDVNNVRVAPDGTILVVGSAARPSTSVYGTTPAFVVLRLQSNGAPVSTFGTNGEAYVQTEDRIATREYPIGDVANDVIVQPDGKIVLGGSTEFDPGGYAPIVVRLMPNGAVDTSFGQQGSGLLIQRIGGGLQIGRELDLQNDGQILLVATGTRLGTEAQIIRINTNGTSFVNNAVRFSFPNLFVSTVFSLALQRDGKIVVGGTYSAQVGSSGETFAAVARLNADLSLDTSFGTGGAIAFGEQDSEFVSSVLIQPDGKIVVTTETGTRQGGLTARLLP